jgi:putative ABC transport system ATP-binding protein
MQAQAIPPVESLLRVDHLEKRVSTPAGTLTLLDDVTFNVKAGDSIAIIGASGSGKSTLLGLLAGLDVPTRGEIVLDGHTLSQLNEEEKAALRARKVGFVFQNFQLLASLTALENVMLPLELRGEDNKHCEQLAKDFLAHVGLSERLHHYPRTLSGGEQQRVALARAFAGQPAILFADEPTGNLDTQTASTISDLLFEMNRNSNATLVLVTHDERLAARCRRRLLMENGSLREITA